jgi:ribose transport system substrate-binding protein
MNGYEDPGRREIDRRSLLRWGAFLVGGVGVSGLTAACSSGVSSGDAKTGGGSTGTPAKSQPKDRFAPSSRAGTKSPLSPQVGMALVTLQGAIQQFADAATATAKQHQLQVSQATNDGNTGKAIAQMNNFIQRQVGALFVQDLTPSAQVPVIKKAIDQGMATFAFNMPANLQLTASQYNVGKQLAHGTLDYISKHMNNKAELVHFNFDYNPAVAPRDQGWRAVMKGRPPGVKIVADVPINPETQEKGNAVMASILQKTPTVNVVDGGDTGVLGALAAFKAAGRGSDPNLALLGVNGDPQAVAEVKSGGPYKATYAFNFAILGVLMSDMADRWLKGLNIPQLALVPAVAIDSPAAITEYNKSISDPASAYKTAVGKYFDLYGSTSYATRGSYYDGTVK